jgi:hypothetical protein
VRVDIRYKTHMALISLLLGLLLLLLLPPPPPPRPPPPPAIICVLVHHTGRLLTARVFSNSAYYGQQISLTRTHTQTHTAILCFLSSKLLYKILALLEVSFFFVTIYFTKSLNCSIRTSYIVVGLQIKGTNENNI